MFFRWVDFHFLGVFFFDFCDLILVLSLRNVEMLVRVLVVWVGVHGVVAIVFFVCDGVEWLLGSFLDDLVIWVCFSVQDELLDLRLFGDK